MIRRRLFLVLFFFIFSISSKGQAIISFEKKTHDFEDIIEGEQATVDFVFTNTGDQPLILSSVRASCGCTTPFWTKEPVNPGETGLITAKYNSKNRPGNFKKSITISSNSSEGNSVLYIMGSVLRKSHEEKIISPETLALSPKLSLPNQSVIKGQVQLGQKTGVEIQLKNEGKSALQIQGLRSSCNCIRMVDKNPTLAPGESQSLQLIYEPKKTGNRTESITLLSNDLAKPARSFILKAEVVEDLSNQSIMKETVKF
ncbi:DUF1573 domain-containing protein [Xanthovirga aplysinae]|uniref:DUF1573 domain-containing protein n=1 Tax=Xanthovirga aplysinae TaxID=2529853 RepID=UPI0012BC6F8A|nr:DUF1573 domain-containing protein [Xanthovirga aplysinae]MTI32796.1 DUF1573 domain-containing protein [Xanthovirga aplysinae]